MRHILLLTISLISLFITPSSGRPAPKQSPTDYLVITVGYDDPMTGVFGCNGTPWCAANTWGEVISSVHREVMDGGIKAYRISPGSEQQPFATVIEPQDIIGLTGRTTDTLYYEDPITGEWITQIVKPDVYAANDLRKANLYGKFNKEGLFEILYVDMLFSSKTSGKSTDIPLYRVRVEDAVNAFNASTKKPMRLMIKKERFFELPQQPSNAFNQWGDVAVPLYNAMLKGELKAYQAYHGMEDRYDLQDEITVKQWNTPIPPDTIGYEDPITGEWCMSIVSNEIHPEHISWFELLGYWEKNPNGEVALKIAILAPVIDAVDQNGKVAGTFRLTHIRWEDFIQWVGSQK
ncbi:MAG: hypothetical protein KDD36_11700 [Flavobacteriales bacterium]|nr:hypothetical protein [Flavobacteriales bacterium]